MPEQASFVAVVCFVLFLLLGTGFCWWVLVEKNQKKKKKGKKSMKQKTKIKSVFNLSLHGGALIKTIQTALNSYCSGLLP
jgi:hypothetical protein